VKVSFFFLLKTNNLNLESIESFEPDVSLSKKKNRDRCVLPYNLRFDDDDDDEDDDDVRHDCFNEYEEFSDLNPTSEEEDNNNYF